VQRTIAAILGVAEGSAGGSLDVSRSFRSFGGDSIAAANLCAVLQREHGVRLSVGFVLGPETAIADLCREVAARLDRRDPAAAAAFEQIHGPSPDVIRAQDLRLERFHERFYKDVMKRPATMPEDLEARSVLLTGATGFLGRFLCLELLERAARTTGTVYCLVRARSDAEAARRLAEVYRPGSALHARFAALADGRLHVLAGDLEQPQLGLPDDRYRALADAADTVVHAAALVNHALPYAELFDANVLGTAEVMRLSLAGRPKRFSFTSTNSVSLALLGERALALETDDTRALGDGWPAAAARHANGYQLSKWAGEVLAQDLFETFGIPVNVFRCNLILPPARARGQIHADDFLTRLVCSVVDTCIFPGCSPPAIRSPGSTITRPGSPASSGRCGSSPPRGRRRRPCRSSINGSRRWRWTGGGGSMHRGFAPRSRRCGRRGLPTSRISTTPTSTTASRTSAGSACSPRRPVGSCPSARLPHVARGTPHAVRRGLRSHTHSSDQVSRNPGACGVIAACSTLSRSGGDATPYGSGPDQGRRSLAASSGPSVAMHLSRTSTKGCVRLDEPEVLLVRCSQGCVRPWVEAFTLHSS
jgi:nucleoside-diphosphate-sugar epimerase